MSVLLPCRLQTDGCVDQYQSSSLTVVTHFVAVEEEDELEGKTNKDEEEDKQEGAGPGKHTYLLAGDWQLDITHLVQDYLRVEDPRVAQLEGRVLVGVAPGSTQLQVGVAADQKEWISVSVASIKKD